MGGRDGGKPQMRKQEGRHQAAIQHQFGGIIVWLLGSSPFQPRCCEMNAGRSCVHWTWTVTQQGSIVRLTASGIGIGVFVGPFKMLVNGKVQSLDERLVY